MSAIYPILMLGGLIFFHEFGHFIIARLFKVTVLEFSIGFGPKIGAFRRGETEYRIGALPLGGYVKMLGADPMAEPSENEAPGSFASKPLWQRSLIILAGPVFNLILPLFIFFFLFLGADQISPSVLGTLQPGGPAEQAGLQPGDVIVSIDGDEVEGWWQLHKHVESNEGTPIEVVVERDGERMAPITLTPKVVTDVIVPQLGLTREVGRIQVEPIFRQPVIWVEPGSAAEASGLASWDRILAIDGELQTRWEYTHRALEKAHASGKPVAVQVLRQGPLTGVAEGFSGVELATLQPARTITYDPSAGSGKLGLKSAEFVVHDVTEGSPEWEAGIRPGDELLTVNGRRLSSWPVFRADVENYPTQVHVLELVRGGEKRAVKVAFEQRTIRDDLGVEHEEVIFGMANLSSYDAPAPVANTQRLSYAWYRMWAATGRAFRTTAAGIGGLFTGKVGLEDTGGPIFIFQAASLTGEAGWVPFFHLMAMLSLSLGLINLLPVPLLDGGHLLFFLIEAVRRRPASLRTRQIAAYVGFSVIIVLMVLVFTNDIARSWDMHFK